MPKCQKNVDYFLDACKKLGVGRVGIDFAPVFKGLRVLSIGYEH